MNIQWYMRLFYLFQCFCNHFTKFLGILRPELDYVTRCDYCLDVQLKFRLKLVTKAFLFYDYLSHTPKPCWSSFVYSTKLLQFSLKYQRIHEKPDTNHDNLRIELFYQSHFDRCRFLCNCF